MGTRRRSREAALQLLYALDMTQLEVSEMLGAAWTEAVIPEGTRDFTAALVAGVTAHRDEIDTLIQEWSTNWSLERIALVERNILRFAIFELLFMPDIPPNVTINEAIEIAKKYGTEEAPAFINGILDRIKHEAIPQPENVPQQ
jgi:N utilization substance protein B